MPREGSFALALLGSLRRVHEPILNRLASKRIVDVFPCSLTVLIIVIVPTLYLSKMSDMPVEYRLPPPLMGSIRKMC